MSDVLADTETYGPVYAAIAHVWGERCSDYESGCPCCDAWAEYDRLSNASAENEKRAEDGYDVYAAAREEYRKKIAEQAAENEKLRAALRYAIENGEGTRYWGDDDDCGTHSCCGNVSYKEHEADCWIVKARAALGGKDE